MDEQAGEAADDGAVDADELQVAAHVEFDAVGGLLAVPLLDDLGDDRHEFGTVGVDEAGDDVPDPALDPGPQVGLVLQARTEVDELGGVATAFEGRLEQALADPQALSAEERRARSGLISREVTLR